MTQNSVLSPTCEKSKIRWDKRSSESISPLGLLQQWTHQKVVNYHHPKENNEDQQNKGTRNPCHKNSSHISATSVMSMCKELGEKPRCRHGKICVSFARTQHEQDGRWEAQYLLHPYICWSEKTPWPWIPPPGVSIKLPGISLEFSIVLLLPCTLPATLKTWEVRSACLWSTAQVSSQVRSTLPVPSVQRRWRREWRTWAPWCTSYHLQQTEQRGHCWPVLPRKVTRHSAHLHYVLI